LAAQRVTLWINAPNRARELRSALAGTEIGIATTDKCDMSWRQQAPKVISPAISLAIWQ
jgi:hypothetical protein